MLENKLIALIEEKGVPLSVVSERSGVPYSALYNSLANKKRRRELKAKELIRICRVLEVNPMDFVDEEGSGRESEGS